MTVVRRFLSFRDFDWTLLLMVLALCTISVFEIFSATLHTKYQGFHNKQMLWIAAGIVAMFMFQVFVNVGMNIGIAPITGIPLPLMSYGGSSVLSTLMAIGLLQSIYAQGRAAAALKGRVLTY